MKKKTDSTVKEFDIPKALEKFRKQMNLTQKEFAEKGNISSAYYSDVVNYRRNPTINKIDEFCRSLGIPFHLLMHQAIIESIEDFSAKSLAIEKLTPLMLEFDKNIERIKGKEKPKDIKDLFDSIQKST